MWERENVQPQMDGCVITGAVRVAVVQIRVVVSCPLSASSAPAAVQRLEEAQLLRQYECFPILYTLTGE